MNTLEHRAKRNAYMRTYYAKNSATVKARVNAYRAANREAVNARKKAYREANAEKVAAGKRDWYERNKARALAKAADVWKARDVEAVRARKRKWRLTTHSERLAVDRAYRKRRASNDLNFRLRESIRARMNIAIRNGARAGSAVRDLGCSIDEFRTYIAARFEPGMSWDNWGEWHLDHIRPLVSFDLSDPEEFRRADHFSNMQPLWARDNRAKGGKYEG